MIERIVAAPAFAQSAPRAPLGRVSRAVGRAVRAVFMPGPSLDEAERRLRTRPSFLASLTPEQVAGFRAYDGPEVLGRGPRRGA